ncbi:MAG: SDR family NAD(P)-dependent oxidoreductase [Stenotrophobium sp.]
MKDDARKVCMVIGAGPGIGQAVAFAFAHEGFDVALVARRPERLAEAAALIRSKTGRVVRAYGADAGDEQSLKSAFTRVRRGMGEIEVMVYNVAATEAARPTTLPVSQLMDEFRVNVAGALVAACEAARTMRKNQRGTLLFTGGSFAFEPATDYASLSLGKAALRNLTFSLAQELGADGIHVATVTVYGFVQSNTRFDPHRIAQAYVQLQRQPKGHFDLETVYK